MAEVHDRERNSMIADILGQVYNALITDNELSLDDSLVEVAKHFENALHPKAVTMFRKHIGMIE